MQRFKELYEKFKHLAIKSENINNNPKTQVQGFIKRPSNDFSNIQNENNYTKKSNAKAYLFNDDI
jgi:hypothetical protein